MIVCPVHGWTYDSGGKLVSAPHYCHLPTAELTVSHPQIWNGLIFGGPRDVANDLAVVGHDRQLDIGCYEPVRADAEDQRVNWKIPIEVLLENYHAPLLHPGFARYTTPGTWYEADGTYDSDIVMFQDMKPNVGFGKNNQSELFRRWEEMILRLNGGERPRSAALVVLYLPNIVLEWWPSFFVVSVYTPRTACVTLMTRGFFVDPVALRREPDFASVAIGAWHETQAADDTVHEWLQHGRAALAESEPDHPAGYPEYQDPMETSVYLFHRLVAHALSRASGEDDAAADRSDAGRFPFGSRAASPGEAGIA